MHAQLAGRHARREAFLKRQPIRVIAEDRAPLVAAAGDVVDRTGIVDAEGTRHAALIARSGSAGKAGELDARRHFRWSELKIKDLTHQPCLVVSPGFHAAPDRRRTPLDPRRPSLLLD